jgi:AcrR family transcriptional regulator
MTTVDKPAAVTDAESDCVTDADLARDAAELALAELVCPPHERRDAAANRQHVLETATRLFAERGVGAVTMDEIARAAGVGKGTLYRRYADKAQLCLALMDACFHTFQEEATAELLRPDRPSSAIDRLQLFLDRLIDWVEEHTAWLGVIASQLAGARRGGAQCSPIYHWLHNVVARLLAQARASGEVRVDDPVYAADVVLAAVNVDLYVYQRRERGYSPDQIRARLHGLVDALRACPVAG